MFFGFEVCGCSITIAIKQTLEDIAERDSKESGAFILKLLEIRVLNGFNGLII